MGQLAEKQLAVVPLIMTLIYTYVAVELLIVNTKKQLVVVPRVITQVGICVVVEL